MLHIKSNKLFNLLPGFSPTHNMQFEPLPAEDDELIQAIDNEVLHRDNNWELEERPDPAKLEAFWREVVNEA